MDAAVHRALTPFAIVIPPTIGLAFSIPELQTPFSLALLAVTIVLIALRPVEREIRMSSQFKTRVLVIGNNSLAQKLAEEIEHASVCRYTIVGVIEESDAPSFKRCRHLILGKISELRTVVDAVRPDLIALAFSDRRGQMPAQELLELQAGGIIVEDIAEAYERVTGKLAIEVVTPGQLMASQQLRKSRLLKMTQRAISLVMAIALLTILTPLLAVIALSIAIDSGRPILFRHRRLGKHGRPFDLLKFRTMTYAERAPSEWVHDNQSRITRIGRMLRRLRLDELPQLVNVIRGDMNLVGPRPHPVTNLQLFRQSIPYYALRSSVLPGITGWAQVRYRYANNLEEETEKMRYDLYYIKHMSVWLDFSIVARTARLFVTSIVRSVREEENPTAGTIRFVSSSARLRIRATAGGAETRPATEPALRGVRPTHLA